MKKTLARIDRYWFGHGSPTTLGLFRIVMSSLIFANLCMILIDFNAWFSERGFVPQRLATAYMPNPEAKGNLFGIPFDFHFSVPRVDFLGYVFDDRITLAFYLLVMLAAVLTALGLWTRISSIAMAVGLVTLQHRNGIILHGGDTVMRVFALYIAIAPSGAACSLDRIIALWKGRATGPPKPVSLWAQRLMTYNVALIYFTTFWHKFGFGSHWKDLTATWYPARLHEFDRFPVPGFVNDLPTVYVTTFMTLAIELALGTIVFYKPARKYVLLAGVMLHAYIDYSMNIPLFSYLMVTLYLTFYEGEEVEGWAKRLGGRLARWRARIFLPENMRFRPGPGMAIARFDPFSLVEYQPGTTPAWAGEARGRPVKPFRAALSRSVGAWPLGLIPYLWRWLLNRALETAPSQAVVEGAGRKAKVEA